MTIATVFGFGLFPIAPGTVGTALAFPLVWALSPFHDFVRASIYIVSFPFLALAANRAGALMGEPDHSAIICDETWAMAVVWELTPAGYGWIIVSFLAFRAFDTVKPWPISVIDQRMKNGLGVMLDDAGAAAYTIALMTLLKLLFRASG
jgi:phosphatidylglycerophosphatase A